MGGFENRASAFISQQDEQLQPVLREVLQLSRLAVGASTGSSELSALAAKVRQLAASSTAAAPLLEAVDLHGLGECVARLPGRSVHTLCHCILNYTLSMCEMLTEDICEAFRRVVEIRSCQAVARRFQDTDFAPLLDGNEQWRAELDCWKALLAPFPWTNARASVMSQVLAAADLSEPLTMHPQLVRSFEILRCLGADLLDNDTKGSVVRLQRHGEKLACWASTEITENTLLAYRQSVVGRKESDVVSLKPAEAAEEAAQARGALDAAAKKLGFVPSALRGRVPTLALVRLAARALREVDEAALPPAGQALARQLPKQPDPAIRNSILQFLLRLAQEFLTRATSKPKTLCLNFELLAGGSPSMQLLRDLETHPSAQLVLNNMALSELLQVMSRILEAHRMVHGEKELPHEALRRWSSRTAAAVPPRELASLSADLEDFLKQNHAARLADLDESLASCAMRALNSLGEGKSEEQTRLSLPSRSLEFAAEALCVLPAGGTTAVAGDSIDETPLTPEPSFRDKQKVVACFGMTDETEEVSPVVVRFVPLGLVHRDSSGCGPGAVAENAEDYQVREVGLRSSGMYRVVPGSRQPGHGSQRVREGVAEDALVVHYQWVPPTSVREDSQSLDETLVSVTHVRIQLPTAEHEELLIDLRTQRVTGSSSWYQGLPALLRDSADGSGGFRRLALAVGPGLRLPLPRQLFAEDGVSESAEVVAQLLALWFSQRHSLEDMQAALRQQPCLTYFASMDLLNRLDKMGKTLMEALRQHWSRLLHLSGSNLPSGGNGSAVLQEAKEILVQLLLAGRGDCLAAVLPAGHLAQFCELVKVTKLSLELLAVERFCFEASLEKIATAKHSTVTFILVEVTGQISALQLSELVRAASGSARLVFSWFPGLLPKLALTRSLGEVLLPQSLREADLSSRSAPTPYRDTFALGHATLQCCRTLPAQPLLLSPLAGMKLPNGPSSSRNGDKALHIDWERNLAEAHAFLKSAHAWMDEERRWRTVATAKPRTHDALLLLVTADEALVQRHYAGQAECVQCFHLNHTDRQGMAPLEALLGRREASTASKQVTIVLFGVGFVTPSKLEDLVARAYIAGIRAILVAPEPLAFLRCIRITTRVSTEYIHATLLYVRSVQSCAAHLPDRMAHNALRSLRMVLGHTRLASTPPTALVEAFQARDPIACGKEMAALPAPEGRQILQTSVAADLAAGIIETLTSTGKASAAFDARSLAFAVGCLTASFVTRADKLGLDQGVWDVSFPDFRARLPICRFLDQASVVEAWCRYLDLVGCEAPPMERACPLPAGAIHWPSKEPKTHFLLSQWEIASNTHSAGLEDMLEQATAHLTMPKDFGQAEAAYFGLGSIHQSEDPEEVLERHCLQGHEMDWGAFSDSWHTALDIKPSLFLQLAGLGVDTLRLFLCLPPARAIELGLTYLITSGGKGATPQAKLAISVTENLIRDLKCTASLLTALSQAETGGAGGASELSPRMAALKWLLLTVISPQAGQAPDLGFCHMTEHALQQLVQSNVMLCPRGRSDLLIRVASMLICFDMDVLSSQHEIKRFLLETDMPMASLLPSTSARVGRAVVSLLFCPDHAEQIKHGELGVSLIRSFETMLGYNVMDWVPLDVLGEPHRLTAAAHAAILEHAPDLDSVRAIVTKPLLAATSKLMILQGAVAADRFLCDVLENLPPSLDTLTLAILKILASEDKQIKPTVDSLSGSLRSTGLLASSKNPFLPALFSALQSRSLGNYLAMVASHKSMDPGRPLLLALDSSPELLDIYIQYFRSVTPKGEIGPGSVESVLGIHNVMLDDASCASLFTRLACGEAREAHQSDLVLMWYCWARSPDKQLPFWALPSFKSGPLCIASLNGSGLPFVERCRPMRFGLSVLAKFLVAPETLPLGVYNTLAEKASWAHAEEQTSSAIKVQTLLLGQEDQEEYPPYCIRWHARALPTSLKKQLLRQCSGSVAPLLDTSLHDFYPRVNSGMGEANLRFNLGLLLALRFGNPDLQVYFDHGADIQRQFLAGCILCWCKAAGFCFPDLLSCVKEENQEDFRSLWQEIHEAYSRTGPASLRRMYVRGPLPTDIDVRWIDDGGKDVPILARTRDSAVLTAQWCNMLLLHFKLTHPEPFKPQDFVVSEGDRLQAGPRLQSALASISEAVGAALRIELFSDVANPSLVVPLGEGKYDTLRLVTRITVLADFVFLLRSSTVGAETSSKIGQFFGCMVGALASGDALADTHLAALFDAFFLLHGLTSENEGIEVEALAKAYQVHNLPVSAQTLKEVEWLHENYYGRRDKATGSVKCRLQRFSTVCDHITSIRSLPLQKVAFQRHFAKTQFVGELLADDSDASPPYLRHSKLQLLCTLSVGARGHAGHGHEAENVEDLRADWADSQEAAQDQDATFFVEVGGDCGRMAGTTTSRSYGQWDLPDLASLHAADWKEKCPVISATDVIEIVSKPSLYLHAALRIRPGLEPVLWHSPKSPGFYRLSTKCPPMPARPEDGEEEGLSVWKAFSTNAEAWQFIDRAHSPVLALDGWYLRKAEDNASWVIVFPTIRDPSEPPLGLGDLQLRPRRHLLWPLCHSHKLVNLNFSSEALLVVQLLVVVAWEMNGHETSGSHGGSKASFHADGAKTERVETVLASLSGLSNEVEHLVSVQDFPESDEGLVSKVRQLMSYQQNERSLSEVLLRILWKMKSQQRDDLGALIREESLRRWATVQVPFVEKADPQPLSSLGRVLQRLLVPIASKAGIFGSPLTTQAWTQLELVLEACYRGEHLPQERCLAKHIHVTKSGFAKRGVAILQSIYHAQLDCRQPPTVQHFSDSEDEAIPESKQAPRAPRAAIQSDPPKRSFVSEAQMDKVYVDTQMDRDPAGGKLFDRRVGFGRPLSSRHGVITFYDEDLPLYYVPIDRQRLKVSYTSSEGLSLGYLVHKNVLAELLEDASKCRSPDGADGGLQLVRSLRMKLLPWIADVLRSPLPCDTKTWILRCCERMGLVAVAPYQERDHVNLAIMAFCLCRCCPAGSDAALFLRNVLMNAWHVPDEVKRFVERKSDVYGIYVVKMGTLQRMRDLGLRVAVRDFEREVWQRSLDNSAMYLDIIAQFSDYCCFTYVKGLSKVDDILLKWLAEYTRLHPWRFVYLEGVDTSFNFPENRDRCSFRFAPPNPLHSVRTMEDLKQSDVAQLRPSHTAPYPVQLQPPPEDLQEPRRLLSFFAKSLGPDSSTGSMAGDEQHQRTMFSPSPPSSSYSADFRSDLEDLLFSPSPCLVLLVSAPGAGKTHHMATLRGRLEEEMQFDIHEFDGSSDILVTTALAEVLQRTMTSQNSMQSQKLLILDEYHMLSDEHKDELFEWVRSKLGQELRVVLIANRSDSKDRERLQQLQPASASSQVRVALLQTRLSRQRIEQVMESRGNSDQWRPSICNWLVASRLLFGEESVSLRLCDGLEAILRNPDPRSILVELLLHRVPTVSRTSAYEFVDAYLQHEGLRRRASATSLVGFCFRVAMLDVMSDEACSFVEFLSQTPKAHEAPPAVRLLAWATYVMNSKNKWDVNGLTSSWAKRHLFVDQVNFPFELGEDALGWPTNTGPTFSWAGDPSSLRDLVDAVRRGHSVDWADVHRKVWSVDHIKDSELFAQLLSLSRNPGMILQQVMPSNLCNLLRLSNTAAPTAVQLARIILQHAPADNVSSQVDRPRCISLWTLVLHDQKQDLNCVDMLHLAGGPAALLDALLWARDWATERRSTAPMQVRTRLLQQLLAMLSCCSWSLVQTQDTNASAQPTSLPLQQLVLLWTGGFGCLLCAASVAQEIVWKTRQLEAGGAMSADYLAHGEVPPALPQARLLQVLERVADVQADWPVEVRLLWRVLHCRSNAREVNRLWVRAPHMMQDLSSKADSARPVHELCIPGILSAPGTFCRALQRSLLCNNCQVPPGISATTFVAACADALNEMRNADQLSLVQVEGAGKADIYRMVKEEMAS
ncbi:PAT23 [Symbiodinium sp. CCMP2456]|nr:PAT23 [Symbiodinium sp. CCMP2456]